MALRVEDDQIIFSSGRAVNINCGLVGLRLAGPGPKAHEWGLREFSEGYDGAIYVEDGEPETYNGISFSDALELCAAMIKAWEERRKALEAVVHAR